MRVGRRGRGPLWSGTVSEGRARGDGEGRGILVGSSLLHLALVLYGMPLTVVFGAAPFGSPDYQTHFQHTHTVMRALGELGRLWVYDPMMLAGYPAGLFFDVDNKAHFAFTAGLQALGVPLHVAFNLFAVLSALVMPVSLWLAARLMGAAPRAQAWTFALAVLLWHFDSLARFFWGGGMISFATASHLCVLVLALFYRELRGPRARGGYAALLVLLPLALLTHVWSFAVLVGPMVALYVASARRIGLVGHARVWALAAAAVAVNAYWLWPAVTHLELMAPSHKLGQATPAYALFDVFELFVNPLTTGFVRQRTMIRVIAVMAALAALLVWRRSSDPRDRARFRYGAGVMGWLFGIAYFGAVLPLAPATEPYRFVMPLACWAAVLGGGWLAEHLNRETWSKIPVQLRGLAIGVLVLLAPRVYGHVSTFVPELDVAPVPVLKSAILEEQFFPSMRLRGTPDDFKQAAAWLAEQPDDGRVLVQYWALGEYLRWATDRPILGGFPDRRTIHEQANLFHFPDEDDRFNDGLGEYLRTFAVSHVIMAVPHIAAVERRLDLLEPRGIVAGRYRVYRVREPSGYFARGRGRVRASLGRVDVDAAAPEPGTQELVLRFHWLRELRCSPGCRIEREPVVGDEAGFIRVVGEPTLPERFSLVQE